MGTSRHFASWALIRAVAAEVVYCHTRCVACKTQPAGNVARSGLV
jgi:hypothetical protein